MDSIFESMPDVLTTTRGRRPLSLSFFEAAIMDALIRGGEREALTPGIAASSPSYGQPVCENGRT
jgi:hypothetical protein